MGRTYFEGAVAAAKTHLQGLQRAGVRRERIRPLMETYVSTPPFSGIREAVLRAVLDGRD